MANSEVRKDSTILISALRARSNFGRLLREIESEGRSMVIEKRGRPRAVLLSIRDYVRLATPEPEVLRALGEESRRNGTSTISAHKLERIIRSARTQKRRR